MNRLSRFNQLIIVFALLWGNAYADNVSDPPPDDKLSNTTGQFLKKIADNLHNLEVVNKNPDYLRQGNYGDMVGYASQNTVLLKINKTTPSGVRWGDPIVVATTTQNISQIKTATTTNTYACTHYAFNLNPVTTASGTQVFIQEFTPTSASNKLMVDLDMTLSCDAVGEYITVALFQDAGVNAIAVTQTSNSFSAEEYRPVHYRYIMSASSTTKTVFKVRIGGGSGITRVNGRNTGGSFGNKIMSSVTITEYTP